MDYADVIFQNDMNYADVMNYADDFQGAGLIDKAKELAKQINAKKAELTEKAKKRGDILLAKSQELWGNREEILAKLSDNAKVAYLETEKKTKETIKKANEEYRKRVEKLAPEVDKMVNEVIQKSNEYKNLSSDKLAEVREKLTVENLNKMSTEAEKQFNNVINEAKKQLNQIKQGGDYYRAKYLKYKHKYFELKNQRRL
jgi:hypothetical protein